MAWVLLIVLAYMSLEDKGVSEGLKNPERNFKIPLS
jgi:hypothetical protein